MLLLLAPEERPSKVWLNDGNGTFTDSGLALGNANSKDVALGDLDGDGDLDAFVANAGLTSGNGGPNKVWLNEFICSVSLVVDGTPMGSTCGTFEVTIQVQTPTDKPVISAELYLTYDPNVLEAVSITPGDTFGVSGGYFDNNHVEFAALNFSGAQQTGQFDLLTIEFQVVNPNWSGSTTFLEFDRDRTEVYSIEYQPILRYLEDIEIPIVAGLVDEVPGKVHIKQLHAWQAQLDGMPLRVRIDPSSPAVQQLNTGNNGKFTLSNLTNGEVVYISQTNTLQQRQEVVINGCEADLLEYELIRGDVSGESGPDNRIDMQDANAIHQFRFSNLDPKDYNLDGEVNAADQDSTFIRHHLDLNDDNVVDDKDLLLFLDYPDHYYFGLHGNEPNPNSPFHVKKGIRELSEVQPALFADSLSSLLSTGDSFDIVIEVQAGEERIISAQAYLNFDPSLLQVNDLTAGDQLNTVLHKFFDNTTGQIEFAAIHFENQGIQGTFELMVVNVTLLGEGGEQTLTLNPTQTQVWGEAYQVLPHVPVKAVPNQSVPIDDITPADCQMLYGVNDIC